MAQRNPAPELPIRTYAVPDVSEQVVIEYKTTETASANPIEAGTPHPNQREFAGFKFGKQVVSPQDPYFTVLFWVKDQTESQTYDYAIKFVSESKAHPNFIRSDREPRLNWLSSYSRTRGTALQKVYGLTVTLAGSGYTVGSTPALTFSGGAGSGAAGHGVVAPDGTISEFISTNGGSGYTSAPTFTVAAPPSGVTATGTAAIQPTGAVLVAEEALEYPKESEFFGLYFNVVRAYQTLPGPIIAYQDYNKQYGAPLIKTKQEKAYGSNLGESNLEIIPIDTVRQENISTDPSILLSVYGSYLNLWPDMSDLPMPDVLKALTSVKNTNFGEGANTATASTSATGTHGSLSISVPISNESSAAINYELLITISSGRDRGRNKPTLRGVFMMLMPYSMADLTAQLTTIIGATVNNWPDFRPDFESLVVKGMSVSVRTEATAQAHDSFDSSSESVSLSATTGISHRVGLTSGPIRISPTIHDAISVGGDGTSDSKTVTASSQAAISGYNNVNTGLVTDTATAAASVSPSSLGATGGQSTYPTTGFYLISPPSSELFEYDWNVIHFEVADFGLIFGSGATAVSLTPVFMQGAGSYSVNVLGTFKVAIFTPTQTAKIRYTTDGTAPTAGSGGNGTLINKFRGFVNLPVGTTTLKAIAYTGNVTAASSVVTGIYIIAAT